MPHGPDPHHKGEDLACLASGRVNSPDVVLWPKPGRVAEPNKDRFNYSREQERQHVIASMQHFLNTGQSTANSDSMGSFQIGPSSDPQTTALSVGRSMHSLGTHPPNRENTRPIPCRYVERTCPRREPMF